MRSKLFVCAFIGFVFLVAASGISGQSRDYFTPEEVELVRDAQDIDLRIMVLTHAVERRFTALKVDTGVAAEIKEPEKWGPAPTGTRLELLIDVKRILQKAVDDIDDTAAHAGTAMEREIENPVKPKKKDKNSGEKPFHRAFRLLAEAAAKYRPVLRAQLDISKDPKEQGAIQASIELCDEIIAAASKSN